MYSSEDKNARRNKIKNFLLECSHYDKDRLIRGAKNRFLFKYSEDDEEVYQSLKKFAKFHSIKIEQEIPEVLKKEIVHEYIEEIDDDGNPKLKLINETENDKDNLELKQLLINRRDELSSELLKINQLLNYYK